MKFSLLHHSPLLALATGGHAVHLPFFARQTTPGTGISANLTSFNNWVYTIDVTLNGTEVNVLIDTGSSDLLIFHNISGTVDQNFTAGGNYMTGPVEGPVASAALNFSGLIIDDQFFIMADNSTMLMTDGVFGIGPSSGSDILEKNSSVAARPPLYRMFASNSSFQPFFAISLNRSQSFGDVSGQLSIGEVQAEYEHVLHQPRLQAIMNSSTHSPVHHWQALMDHDGIIVNGKPIELSTNVTGANVSNPVVVFDTGFFFTETHPSVAEAVYGNIPSATFQNVSEWGRQVWVLDCSQVVNVTFKFSDMNYPIHPLDLSIHASDLGITLDVTQQCIGGLQSYANDTIGNPARAGYDIGLGVTFLRNAVMAVTLGNSSMANESTPANGTAYIQLLSITDPAKAVQEFNSERGNNGSGDDGSYCPSCT